MLKNKRNEFMPLGTIPSQMECIRCGAKLNLLGVGAAAHQMYICTKCGYNGPIGLEPGIVKIDKKRKI
jgi:DNA-directed RNA polymerase subunit RPC12/RpoP